MVHMTCRMRRFRTAVLGRAAADGSAGFSRVTDDEGLSFALTFLPLRHTSKLGGGGVRRRLEGLYCFNCIFQLTYVAFKKSG